MTFFWKGIKTMKVKSLQKIYIPFDGHILYVGDIIRNVLSDEEAEEDGIVFQPVMYHQEGLCRLMCISFHSAGDYHRIVRYLVECMGEVTELQIDTKVYRQTFYPYHHEMDWSISEVKLPAIQVPTPCSCESEVVPVSITIDSYGELIVGTRHRTITGGEVFVPVFISGEDSIKFYQLEAFQVCQDHYFLTGLWTDSYTARLLKISIGPDFCPQVKVHTSHITGNKVMWEPVR